MKVFGIDPGSERTGYGCVDSDGRRHRLVRCGAVQAEAGATFAERLGAIYRTLIVELDRCRPDCVAIENLFYATNVRSALKLGHARGVAMLAAVECGLPVLEYTPAEIKRAIVGYGRAEKGQVQQMVKLLLRLEQVPSPHDAADALAVAICHIHQAGLLAVQARAADEGDAPALRPSRPSQRPSTRASSKRATARSWRDYRPPTR